MYIIIRWDVSHSESSRFNSFLLYLAPRHINITVIYSQNSTMLALCWYVGAYNTIKIRAANTRWNMCMLQGVISGGYIRGLYHWIISLGYIMVIERRPASSTWKLQTLCLLPPRYPRTDTPLNKWWCWISSKLTEPHPFPRHNYNGALLECMTLP